MSKDWGVTWDKLESLIDLKEDWDGSGGLPPTSVAIQQADNLLTTLKNIGAKPPNRVVCGENQNVWVEYQDATAYCGYEVTAEGDIRVELGNS